MSVIGKRVVSVIESDGRMAHGAVLGSLTTNEWWYADLYVGLEDGTAIRLSGSIVELCAVPLSMKPPRYESFVEAIGLLVEDIVMSESEAFVVLQNGRYVENAFVAGGTRAIFGSFSEWIEEERIAPLRSWLTGRAISLAEPSIQHDTRPLPSNSTLTGLRPAVSYAYVHVSRVGRSR
jgi:hypothetical protein